MLTWERMTEEIYDVAIIGGGPPGARRRRCWRERDGASSFWSAKNFRAFTSANRFCPLARKLSIASVCAKNSIALFMPKHGGEIMAACGTKSVKFYFKDGFRSSRDRAYQVTRSEFDKLLLDHSRENGAEVREETEVKRIDFRRRTAWP